jgi:8-oxo-dGTP diphosphatase
MSTWETDVPHGRFAMGSVGIACGPAWGCETCSSVPPDPTKDPDEGRSLARAAQLPPDTLAFVPTPSYILQLRRHHGHDLLLLPGVSAVVLDDTQGSPRILLVRRSDTGRWGLPAGIVEPGEQPAATLLRELAEETRVVARVDRLALLVVDPEMSYPNGDRCQYVSMGFRCSYVSGEAAVGDEESTEVRWFGLDELPELAERDLRRIIAALPERGETIFDL